MENTELQEKWQDYLFLTEEMKKFIMQRDLELFFALVDQRGVLQQQIEKLPDEAYYTSSAGKALLQQIKLANAEMLKCFHMVFNAMKQQENVVQKYEGSINYAGNYLNTSR
ncbi:MAG: hypothetical protein LLG02_11780 [Pelosinus sp.]|nr:hypothetical protein [Pelosinus sp.]